jgi:ABC-type uncharacterized transport system substrate-binding protein
MSFHTTSFQKEKKATIENKFKENGSHQEHFTHFIKNGKEIKIGHILQEISANSNRLIVQSNIISRAKLSIMET